jgi:phospholipid/cholesterol/gamma-HCH transport system substrate-binding protein
LENKSHALAAGVFVVIMAVLLVLLATWLTRDAGDRDRYEISTRETVTGLQEQAPVRYRGVDVGKVTAITFDPKSQGNVLVQLDIERGAPVTRETFATLGFQGVTGLAFVQLDDSGQPAPLLVPNDEVPPRIPLKPGLLSKLTAKGEVILDQVEQITVRMNQMLADPNQKRIASALDNVGEAAASVSKLSNNFNTIMEAQFGPREVNIPKLVKSTEQAVSSLRATSDEARAALGEVGKTAARLNSKDGPIDRLAEGTEALSHAADSFNSATLPRINRATEDTSRAVRQLSRTVNNINDNPQSLIFGSGRTSPGPGEPGFTVPGDAP